MKDKRDTINTITLHQHEFLDDQELMREEDKKLVRKFIEKYRRHTLKRLDPEIITGQK